MKTALTLLLALCVLLLAACDPVQPTADQKERADTEHMAAEANAQVGMPAITHFQEKRMVKQLYELRDNPNYRTYAYITDLNGNLHKFCDAVGFGIPYATQYSNPQKDIFYSSTSAQHMALPQAEPNGLFMPASADGTWVMCLDPSDKQVKPVFVEPRVVVSPFPLATEACAPVPALISRSAPK